jgi:hypothetical protein
MLQMSVVFYVLCMYEFHGVFPHLAMCVQAQLKLRNYLFRVAHPERRSPRCLASVPPTIGGQCIG